VLQKRFEELKLTGNLPSPSGVGLAVLQLAQREDASMDEVVGVLQSDPILTGRIFKLSNTGEASGYQPASTLRAAAMRLGLRTVCNVSLGFSLLAGNRAGRCKTFDYDGFWAHSLAVAACAQALAESRRGVPPGEAFTCGLLSGIGRMALASIHPAEYEDVLVRAQGQSSQRLAEIEQEILGTNHRELAVAMLRDWKLPPSYADAVGFVGSGASIEELTAPASQRLASVLQDARDLARALTVRSGASAQTCRRACSDLEALRERLQIEPGALDQLWNKVSKAWRTWAETVRLPTEACLGLSEIRQRAEQPDEAARAAAGLTAPAASSAEAAATAGLKVLLIGLDPQALGELQGMLERDGHEVAVAADGAGGLARALEQVPHVAVIDWTPGRLEGLELVRTLRKSEQGSRMHCLLLADRDQDAQLQGALGETVDEYLLKPASARTIRARVQATQRMVRLAAQVEVLLRERETQLGHLAILTRKLEVAALTDVLTGLFNRRHAMQRLNAEIKAARASQSPLSVIMLDIDRFKSVNDEYGHDVGDVVLRETAQLVRTTVRKSDTPCRLGGEEFLVICPGVDLRGAAVLAERLRATAAERVIRVGTFQRPVTMSLGVAQLDPSCADADALIKRADQRVYLAKQSGRNRIAAEDPAPTLQRAAG
jgi:diguanylate cyclase (GGDEF)-like protein